MGMTVETWLRCSAFRWNAVRLKRFRPPSDSKVRTAGGTSTARPRCGCAYGLIFTPKTTMATWLGVSVPTVALMLPVAVSAGPVIVPTVVVASELRVV